MNSAATVVEAPEQIMSYADYWKQNNAYGTVSNPDQLMVKFLNLFTGEDKRVKSDYDAYVANINNRNEAKATQSARAFEEYMSSTGYQRAFDDLSKSGINPYMLVNGGVSPSAGSSSSPKASYSKPSLKDDVKTTSGRDIALLVLAVARLIAAL